MARKARKQIIGLTMAGFTAGIGATALSRMGGTVGSRGATALQNTTRFYPVTGTLVGAGMLLRKVKRLRRL